MKLLELFITETTEEDRAIISLSSTVYRHIQKYADYVEPDSSDTIDTGKIDDYCTTPLDGMEDISVVLIPGDVLREKIKKERKESGEEVDDDEGKVTLGQWDANGPTIFLNSDYITSNAIKSTITHELRHALDDLKSGGKANASTKYRTPKNKKHRKKDPYLGDLSYKAQPAEINARFAQVLHAITTELERASLKDLPPDQLRARAESTLKRSMQTHKISYLFPQKDRSPDYKRLLKRAADFIQKEIKHLTNASF